MLSYSNGTNILKRIEGCRANIAENMDINLQEFAGEKLSRVETALVKIGIKYCKRKRCEECPVREFCGQVVG